MTANTTLIPVEKGPGLSRAVGTRVLKRIGLDLIKGIAAALASTVGLVMGGMVTRALGMPTPVAPIQINMTAVFPLMFLSGIVISIVVGECFQRLYPKYWQRLLAIWLCHYLLYYLLNTLDAFLFMSFTNLSTTIVSNLFPALFASAVIALVWRPGSGSVTDSRGVVGYFSARKPGDWAWRLVLAWLIFPPIYYLAGRAVALFTLRYYTDPSLNTGLTLNLTLESLMAMQVLRGALFLLAVLPIIFAWRGTRIALWLQVGAVIFIQIAIQTILQAYWLPFLAVRIPHGIELLVDSFTQAYVYALLLFTPSIVLPGDDTGPTVAYAESKVRKTRAHNYSAPEVANE